MKIDLARLWGRSLPPRAVPRFSDPEYAWMGDRTGYGGVMPSSLAQRFSKAKVVEVRVPNQEWLVKYRGSFWRARTRQKHLSLAVGDEARVVSRYRNVLIVEIP